MPPDAPERGAVRAEPEAASGGRAERSAEAQAAGRAPTPSARWRALLLPVAALLSAGALPFVLPTYYVCTLVLVYAMAAVGLNLLWGHAGLMSFGQGIFFGFGAYGSALVMIHLHWGLIRALLTGLVLGAAAAAAVGFLAVRRRGIYFVLLTFAFAEMFAFLVYAFGDLTGGENGLLGVPRPALKVGGTALFGYHSDVNMYVLSGVLFVIVMVFILVVTRSRFGSTLRAVRDNEDRARALGYNVKAFKVLAFTISGAVTGIAGVVYALLLRSVPDSAMQLATSSHILVMTIVGGSGNLYGSFLGALGITVLSDQLSYVWARWNIILGLVLIVLVLFLKGGIWGGLAQLARWLLSKRGGSDE